MIIRFKFCFRGSEEGDAANISLGRTLPQMLPQSTYSDDCTILKTGWRLSAHTNVNTLTFFTEVLPAHVSASTTNSKGTTTSLKNVAGTAGLSCLNSNKFNWTKVTICHLRIPKTVTWLPTFSLSISFWGKAKIKTNKDRKIMNKMHESATKWPVLHGQKRFQPEEGGSGAQRASVHRSDLHLVWTIKRLELDICDGSVSFCRKSSSLLRNLAFSLWQKERALSASWKQLLTAVKAACGGKTRRKTQSYQTECHTRQERELGVGVGGVYGGV